MKRKVLSAFLIAAMTLSMIPDHPAEIRRRRLMRRRIRTTRNRQGMRIPGS